MTLSLEDDSRPPYVQVADYLRRQINAGELGPGDKVPSSRELQEKFGLASATIQNAFRLLKSEGLIYSVQGRGSFIRRPASESDATAGGEGPGDASLASTPVDSTSDVRYIRLSQEVADLRRDVASMRETLIGALELIQQLKDQGLGEDA
ncbi:GntR family transcriptional regulator [Streptomyces sp. NBC_01637]|uniref:GntR family transcriptional regulator n=1 Tax=unclassified Streptomyces TaxID=2593676 RepID=UPI00386AFF2A|nr:GntR family transcriptional regulator [Streptomyces sp. NBC_01653]WTD89947.1 GntR family transcriptional regulator [Streptomyces sp. NBC_01637]